MLTTFANVGAQEGLRDAQAVIALSLAGLPQMLDPERNLFCFRMLKTRNGLVREGVSQRYTVMTLLGLHRAEMAGLQSSIDKHAVFTALLEDKNWIDNAGDLGLLLWLGAVVFPERLPELCEITSEMVASRRFDMQGGGKTMETAWLLSGLSHAVVADQSRFTQFRDWALSAYDSLCKNQAESGLFGHQRANSGALGIARGRIGSFADQVYPIYTLSQAAMAFEFKGSLDRALSCAEAICARQGALGQWWWHYESVSGRVVGRFPVYPVHQDGMAPMALFALSDASGMDFSKPIYRGLQWVTGNNELALDLRDDSAQLIWRNIRTSDFQRYAEELRAMMSRESIASTNDLDFRVTYECRPYELGWALYALAGRVPAATDSQNIAEAVSEVRR